MRIAGIFLAIISILFGLRLIVTALQAILTGRVLVRQGIRTKWQPAPDMSEVWKVAFRDVLMGVLLIILGVMLIF
ncbi:MAG TPA: hypothetical protein P5526_25630 [Anaerolineae bacterium]|nr:hypothetical protein [Anaerolineae bacterium]MCB9108816.1 hypothetical protein [Anaerolineales bacterium]HRV95561.1 hypothetical protein [Anaerolineae bacterium]